MMKQLKIPVHTFSEKPRWKQQYAGIFERLDRYVYNFGRSHTELRASDRDRVNGRRRRMRNKASFFDQNDLIFAMYYVVRSTYYVVRTTFARPKIYKAGFVPKQEMSLLFFYKTMLTYSVIHTINNIAQKHSSTTKKNSKQRATNPSYRFFHSKSCTTYYILRTAYCVVQGEKHAQNYQYAA